MIFTALSPQFRQTPVSALVELLATRKQGAFPPRGLSVCQILLTELRHLMLKVTIDDDTYVIVRIIPHPK